MNIFNFYKDRKALSFPNDRVVRVSKGISDQLQIFETYENQLKIPEDFGKNWDAFFDNLKGFDFIENKNVIAMHEDMPLSNNRKYELIYLRILVATVEFWREHSEHKFFVYFPEDLKVNVQQILEGIQVEVKRSFNSSNQKS